jgi:hypothetical protein
MEYQAVHLRELPFMTPPRRLKIVSDPSSDPIAVKPESRPRTR